MGATTKGNRLTAATVFAAASVTLRTTRVIENPEGGVGTVTVAPVASNTPLLSKSQRKVRAPVQPRHEPVPVKVRGEPGIGGLGEKLQKTLHPSVAVGS